MWNAFSKVKQLFLDGTTKKKKKKGGGAGKLGRQTALSVQETVTKWPRLTMPDGPNISPQGSAERLWTTRGIKSGENHNVKT